MQGVRTVGDEGHIRWPRPSGQNHVRTHRATTRNLRAAAAAAVVGLVAVAGLASAPNVAAAPIVAPAADVTTLDVVPPEPAPVPVIVVAPVEVQAPAPAEVVAQPQPVAQAAPAPARVAGSQVEAPADSNSDSGSAQLSDAHAVSNERSYSTSNLRIEIAATDSAHRTATIRDRSGAVIAGPFNVDGAPIVLDGLDAGDIDLLLEDATEASGTTMTRTPISLVAGRTHVARCDSATLDCTVS